jgi:NAD(P)-dependent dehydrogenase (short-subunit alcohol dehydrogenase family)
VDLREELPPEGFGDVDVCVSNAGVVDTISPAHRMSRDKWNLDIGVNLTGAFRVVQACLPGMRDRGYGRIVVISSSAAIHGGGGQVAYAAAKAGLLGVAKTVAVENIGYGITVNSVLPGLIATPKVLAMPEAVMEQAVNDMRPAVRLGEPSEIAAVVAFLASEEASYVTAQEISVDGGLGLNRLSLGNPARPSRA